MTTCLGKKLFLRYTCVSYTKCCKFVILLSHLVLSVDMKSGPKVIKKFMLISAERGIFLAHKC